MGKTINSNDEILIRIVRVEKKIDAMMRVLDSINLALANLDSNVELADSMLSSFD
jgi:hypothetical protein